MIGKFCGDFPPPKVPFSSSPFFGDYASTGGGRLGFGEDGSDSQADSFTEPESPAPETPAEPAPSDPSGGTGFDPEQYEAPPQGPPETGDGE